MNTENDHWAVLGGGMLGLTAALRLAQKGYRVTVFEAAQNPGGLTSSFSHDSVSWDRFYHVIDARDQQLLSLLDELGLGESINWAKTNTNFYDGEKIYPLNDVFDYARLPVINLLDKFRLGLNIFYGSLIRNGLPLEQKPASEWLIRWSGRRNYKNLWRPLLRAKLGENAEIASAAYIWATIQRFYGARQGKSKTELYGYVDGGYALIVKCLLSKLEDLGVKFEFGAPIQRVTKDGEKTEVTAKTSAKFDKVVVTFASPIATKVCPQLSDLEQARHNNIRYQGVVCSSLLLKRPLGNAYLTYITDDTVPFTTIIEMTSLVTPENYGGRHLVYLPKYVPSNDPILGEDIGKIEKDFTKGLQKIYPDLTVNDIDSIHTAKAPFVTAISTQKYSENLPSIKTSIEGLYICNSAQILNASLTVNESVELANKAIDDLAS